MGLFGRLLRWGLVAAIWGVVALGAVIAYYGLQLPPIDTLDDPVRRAGITVLAADGSAIEEAGDVHGRAYRVQDLPPHVPGAVIAIEDRRFYSHFGVDLVGLARAFTVNLIEGRPAQGGSTLTQQVAKNVFLTNEKSLKRKVQELILALWLEQRYSKDQILGIYLNRVYLGSGVYGIDAAARRYFGKSARELDLLEAAVLAGMLKSPSRINPARDPAAAAARADLVLAAMVRAGMIDEAQRSAALAQAGRLTLAAAPRPGRYFADWVLDQVPALVNPDRDLVVRTTLDPALQRRVEARVEALLAAEGDKRRVQQAAVVVMDTQGRVRAMVGGRSYARSQFNRAVSALRQPGSAFKPILFAAALEAGWQADSPILDAPVRIGGWSPDNSDRRYRGEIPLTQALAESVNTAAARLIQSVGLNPTVAMARRLGLSGRMPRDLTVALGAGEANLLELTAAYIPFAASGRGAVPGGIAEIRDRDGRAVWRPASGSSETGDMLSPTVAAAMRDMLAAVVESGTGRAASPGALGPGIRGFGKTGTTSDYVDAWFIGWVEGAPEVLLAGVWLGNDNNQPMDRVGGGDLPARLWRGIVADILGRDEARPVP